MTETKKPDQQKSAVWLFMAALVGTAVLYFDVLRWMVSAWSNNSDYSHGFLVPFFAAYILWTTRSKLKKETGNPQTAESGSAGVRLGDRWTIPIGMGLVILAIAMRAYGMYTRVLTLEGISLLPFLLGVFILCFGLHVWRWAWGPVLFLAFMIPLPSFLTGQLAGVLQAIATQVSTFSLQTLGFPAFAEGNVITLSQGQIGVAEACSGLRMLYSFFALTVGACLMIDRHWIEKIIIAAMAIPIAIAANCVRIIATGIAFEYFSRETAEHLFHDVAGWLMVPLGFMFLMVALAFLDRVLVVDEEAPEFARR